MFNHLIESDSHRADVARKGSFLLATMLGYALLLAAAGVLSIYAYDARLTEQNLDANLLITPVTLAPPASTSPPERHTSAKQSSASPANNTHAQISKHSAAITATSAPLAVPNHINVKGDATAAPMLPRAAHSNVNQIGDNFNGLPSTMNPNGSSATGGATKHALDTAGDAPEPTHTIAKPPKPQTIASLGVVNSKALILPAPPYPQTAKLAHAAGLVTVEVLIDETGRVIAAHAIGGHTLLRQAAVQAALQAKFSPTLLSHQPVKASGIINYNFTLQ